MKVHYFSEIDSTSTYLMEGLRSGSLTPPVAVAAGKQITGRGRLGRNWDSPEGNLYISFAFSSVPTADLTLVPLQAAVIMAKWLSDELGIRVTLKWPNDLLFGGAKLAGILCEGISTGGQTGSVVIGIGLNVNHCPEVGRLATSLQLITRAEHDLTKLQESLTEAFNKNWGFVDISRDWPNWGIEAGQLWVDKNNGFHSLLGLGEDGSLKLADLTTGVRSSLVSVSSDYQWVYQSDNPQPLWLADIGNSAYKIYGHGSHMMPKADVVISGLWSDPVALEQFKELNLPAKSWPLHVASVNPAGVKKLASALKETPFFPIILPSRRVRLKEGGYSPKQLGIDRLALMEGCLADLCKPDEELESEQLAPQLVVSAGTATTIDLISGDRRHLGGWILPGLQTKLNALGMHTGLLPQCDIHDIVAEKFSKDPLGHSTQEAMINGVLGETMGGIIELQSSAEQMLGHKPALRISGGYGNYIADAAGVSYDPHLIAKGFRTMVLGG